MGRVSRNVLTVIFASTKFSGHQLYDQRLARALAAHESVLYVEPQVPVFGLGREKTTEPPADLSPGLEVLVPRMLPYGRRRALLALTGVMYAVQVWWHILRRYRTRKFNLIVIATNPYALRFFPSKLATYLVKDDYSLGDSLIGIPRGVLLNRFRKVMRNAATVVVVSPVLQQTLLRRGLRARVIPAGCNLPAREWPEPTELRDIPAGRVVFIGMISDRIDIGLLHAVVDAGHQLIVVGERQNTFTSDGPLALLEARDGFHRLAPRTGADLEAVIQHCDVGLIPYTESDFNRASFPLKAFEYLACGKAVVSTPLPSMEWLGSRNIHIATGTHSFVAQVSEAIQAAGSDDVVRDCKRLASANTWASRAETFISMRE